MMEIEKIKKNEKKKSDTKDISKNILVDVFLVVEHSCY